MGRLMPNRDQNHIRPEGAVDWLNLVDFVIDHDLMLA
jgi:hypothetical protein